MNFLAKLFLFFFLSFYQAQFFIDVIKDFKTGKMNSNFLSKNINDSPEKKIDSTQIKNEKTNKYCSSSSALTITILIKHRLLTKILWNCVQDVLGVQSIMRIVAWDFFINDYLLQNLSTSTEKSKIIQRSSLVSLGIFTNIFVKKIVDTFFPHYLPLKDFDLEMVFEYVASTIFFNRSFYKNKLYCPQSFGFLHIGDQQGFSFSELSIFNDLLIFFKTCPNLAFTMLNMGEGEFYFALNQLFPDGGLELVDSGYQLGEYKFFFDKNNFIGYKELFEYLLNLGLIQHVY